MLEITSATNSLAQNFDAHIQLHSDWVSGRFIILYCRVFNGQRVFSLSYNICQTLMVLEPMPSTIGEEVEGECLDWTWGVQSHRWTAVFFVRFGKAMMKLHTTTESEIYAGAGNRGSECFQIHMHCHAHTCISDSPIGLSGHSQAKYSSPISVHTLILPSGFLYYLIKVSLKVCVVNPQLKTKSTSSGFVRATEKL